MVLSPFRPASPAVKFPADALPRGLVLPMAAAILETVLFCSGAAMILLAILADRQWLDRHVLPHMFLSRNEQILWWMVERGTAFVLGLTLVCFVRPWATRRVRQAKGKDLLIQSILAAFAIASSALASELVLRTVYWRGVDRWATKEEPLRRPDPYIGWTNVPARTGIEDFYGRRIIYHIDAGGHRISDPALPVDYAKPSILFTGESIMFGFRLNWPETVAGQTEAITGIQSANLAVNGYSTDQAFMRLTRELHRYARPVAVVGLFSPTLLERNLDKDRPHLDAALRWHPGRPHWRLQKLAKNVVLYRSTRQINQGIAMTRAVLRATVLAAHARHAKALILVLCFAPEQPTEREIRRRVLDQIALPYVMVSLDPRWRLAHDGHPDARADRAMATAIVQRLALSHVRARP